MFQSLWFRGLLALLSLSIMVNVASRTPGIIAVVRRPPVKVPTRFFSRAPLRVTVSFPVPPDDGNDPGCPRSHIDHDGERQEGQQTAEPEALEHAVELQCLEYG
ncbi:MAG: hypothetical protein EBV45_08195 [Chloroflexi bacterium]|nr:hypothetical protein [Chloroflexota bacterium]